MIVRNSRMVIFEFKPITPKDFPLLMKWHKKPHVLKNWNSFSSYEEMCASYEKKLRSDFVFCFLVYFQNRPIGYIQTYQAWRVGEGWWPNEKEGCWGMDQFIGEIASLGQGLGPKFMDEFVQYFLAEQNCKKVIVDPSPENSRAIRAYEKAGFSSMGMVETPDGSAILMVRNL